jgi:hypothetical protein
MFAWSNFITLYLNDSISFKNERAYQAHQKTKKHLTKLQKRVNKQDYDEASSKLNIEKQSQTSSESAAVTQAESANPSSSTEEKEEKQKKDAEDGSVRFLSA